MPKQSTNHILLIKPASFYSNEQTADTNLYQHSHEEKDKNELLRKALLEFNNFENSSAASFISKQCEGTLTGKSIALFAPS